LQAASLKDLLHLPRINYTRNGIIWCAALEIAYTSGAFGLGVNDRNEYFFVLLDKNWECMQLKDFGCPKGAPTSEQVTPTPLLQYGIFDLHTLCVYTFAAKQTVGC